MPLTDEERDRFMALIEQSWRAWYDAGWFDRAHGETKDLSGTNDTDRLRCDIRAALGFDDRERVNG